VALDATLLATNRVAMGELGGTYLSPAAQVRLAGVAGSNGQYGALLQVGSQGSQRLAFNFDLRHIRVAPSAQPAATESPPVLFGPDAFTGSADPAIPLAQNTFSQVSGSVSYSLQNARFGFAASYRKERGRHADYSYGPSFRWEFLRKGQLRMGASGDLAITSQGRSGYVGVNLQLLGSRISATSNAGMRSAPNQANGAVGNVNGTWQDSSFAGGELSLGAGYDHSPERDSLSGNAELRGDKVSLRGDLAHSLGRSSNPTQYSLGFQTTLAMSGGRFALRGRDQNDSMVMVKVDGAGPNDRFDVLVNDGTAGTLRGSGSSAVAVPAYRQYDIRIRQTDGDLLQFDGTPRRVGLYPGNVTRLSWKARRITAMFGRLMLDSGEPVRMASLTSEAGIGETDENGYFQIEGEIGATITVTLQGGRSCRVTLPSVQPQDGYAPLGTLVCRAQAEPFRISSAGP
jgi:Mat/Ecp fimbriae outer membrane usher protein